MTDFYLKIPLDVLPNPVRVAVPSNDFDASDAGGRAMSLMLSSYFVSAIIFPCTHYFKFGNKPDKTTSSESFKRAISLAKEYEFPTYCS
jgi:hypothetical protein